MKVRHIIAAAALTLVVGVPAAARQMGAQEDRAKAAAYLEETRSKFLKSIEGVSDAQWKFKPSPTVWSIAEVAEHIAISESTILGMIQDKMLTMPAPKAEER